MKTILFLIAWFFLVAMGYLLKLFIHNATLRGSWQYATVAVLTIIVIILTLIAIVYVDKKKPKKSK